MTELKVRFLRYLVEQHSTLYVALPREYTTAMHLTKDTEVVITVSTKGKLIIEPVEFRNDSD